MLKNCQILYIKKRSLPQWLTLFIFVMPFLIPTFLQFLGLPGFVKYSIDIAWIIAFVALVFKKELYIKKQLRLISAYFAVYFIFTFIIYLINFQSIIYYLWGFRNSFRLYIAFLLFSNFLDTKDSEYCLDFIDLLFWLNAIISLFQFLIMGYEQDYLGGIFGVERGSNAFTLIFFSIVIAKSVLRFMNDEENPVPVLLKCAVALLVSALAELKFFFVVFALIVALAAVLTKFSWKKMAILIILAVFVFGFGSILPWLFGESSNISFERILELITADNYATTEDLGRFTAIPTIAETIHDSIPSRLFGLGMGNCDTSSFAICNTPFYQKYSYLHYTWFSSAFIYLETGYIGLLLNLGFYIICLVFSLNNIRTKQGILYFNQLSAIIALLCIVFTFYNASLRSEVGYIAFFILSLPFTINASQHLQYSRNDEVYAPNGG